MEQKVPKMRNIVGYGTGDIAGNVVYAFLSSFCNDLSDKHGRIKCGYCRNIDCSIKAV